MREIRTGDEQWTHATPVEWEWSVSKNGNPYTTLPDRTRLVVFRNRFKDGWSWMRITPAPNDGTLHEATEQKYYDKLAYADVEECKRMALRMAGQEVAEPPVVNETPAMTRKIDATIGYGERRIRL